MNKKLLALCVIASVFIISIAGCKDNPTAPPDTPDVNEKKTENTDDLSARKQENEKADENEPEKNVTQNTTAPDAKPKGSLADQLDPDQAELLIKMLQHAQNQQTKCPIMGKPVDSKIFSEYKGQKIYFCCTQCKEKFQANPEKYLSKQPQPKN